MLQNARKLKGTGIFVNEDFSKNVRMIRQKLRDRAKDERAREDKVTLAFNKLKVNELVLRWDAERQQRIALGLSKT